MAATSWRTEGDIYTVKLLYKYFTIKRLTILLTVNSNIAILSLFF